MTADSSRDAFAVVTRAVAGGKESLGFLSRANPNLFCRMLAPDRPSGGVLICPTLSVARQWSEWRERELLTDVVRRGRAGMVFDYRGEGRSAAPGEPGLTALCHDVVSALEVLTNGAPPSGVKVVGIGVGGLIAAEALTDRDVPVASWGSPPSGREFFLDVMRERVIQQMGFSREGDTSLLDRVAVDTLDEEVGRGSVDALGFAMSTVVVSEVSSISTMGSQADSFAADEPSSSIADWASRGGES